MDIDEMRKKLVTCPHCDCRQSFYHESGSVICPNCKKEFYVQKCTSCQSQNIVPELSSQIKCWNCNSIFITASEEEPEPPNYDSVNHGQDLVHEEYTQPLISYCLKVLSVALFLICAFLDTFTESNSLKVSLFILAACWIIAAYFNYKEKQRVNENNEKYWIQFHEKHERLRREEEAKKQEFRRKYGL